MIELLARQGAMPAGAIAAHFTVSSSAISQHLRHLTEAGLVSREVRGQQRVYRLRPEALRELEDWVVRTRWFWTQQEHGGG